MKNIIYIATSIDGYIADRSGGLDWLSMIPNPDKSDFGWSTFISNIDAILMGRKTFETVCNFDCPWPYTIPVYVLSNSLNTLIEEYQEKAQIIKGSHTEILEKIHNDGYKSIYIDGGTTIRSFLEKDLIDEMTIGTIPILLGGGTSLFNKLSQELKFELIKNEVLLGQMVMNTFRRKR